MMFKKATRQQAKLKLAITGPSGSGKTMSALRMASAMGKSIAVIDTENGSASLYADKFDFDVVNLSPPFTNDKYIKAIEAAEASKYDVIILDSYSHAWAGEGGTLDKKADLDARGGSQFGNWREPKREYGHLKNAILHSSAHIICTIRSKQAYELVEENGKKKPQKFGMDPIAEPGIEYEFTTVFDVAENHKALASKDRTGLFAGQIFQITEETGKALMAWLTSGKAVEHPKEPEPPKAEDKPTQYQCAACSAELVNHPAGLVCPNASKKGDQHTRILKSEMKKVS